MKHPAPSLVVALQFALGACAAQQGPSGVVSSQVELQPLEREIGVKPRNVVFILADDHRYDAMGFMGRHPWLKTPNMDAMAKAGVHMKNAFVTTALCSPSRASILTGLYTHRHGVVDNNHSARPGVVFFPQHLQQVGYQTAFIGKWHMGGETDEPQPGFDRWVSFLGQGNYLPNEKQPLNVDGTHVPQKGYITDELTDYALDWLKGLDSKKPFFLYLSHKAVHSNFEPAERHKGTYAGKDLLEADSFALSEENLRGRPRWVQDQRNSWHGVDYPYHGNLDINEYFRRYAEALLAVDESIGRVMDFLKQAGVYESTMVIYMGDNGFAFGEHGLIDKRTAYEESMRVPMLVQCPELIAPGQTIEKVVANIDIGPTVLAASGQRAPATMDGANFLPLVQGKDVPWRDVLLYEYFWERNFPHTPTVFAVRGDRYKYIRVHGVWDSDELYDLKTDPMERHNLIYSAEHKDRVTEMNRRLWEILEETGGLAVPLQSDHGGQNNRRRRSGPTHAPFPDELTDDQ